MNRQGHIMSSQFILIVGLGAYLFYLLQENGRGEVATAIILGISVFLFSTTVPDWDHPKVHEKIFFLRWLGKVTKHRGHWHSIIAAMIYTGIIALILWPFNIHYWYIIVAVAFFGYVCHLIEDDLNRYKLKSKPKRGFKIW